MLALALFTSILLALPASALPHQQSKPRAVKDRACIPLQETGLTRSNSLCIVSADGERIPEESDCEVVGDTSSSCKFSDGLVLDQVCVSVEDGCEITEDELGFECEAFKVWAGDCF